MARPHYESDDPRAQDRICNAMRDLMLKTEAGSISVRQLSEAAGCNRSTFYYHFESIDSVVGGSDGRSCTMGHAASHALRARGRDRESDRGDIF